jgi:hypothetical protein
MTLLTISDYYRERYGRGRGVCSLIIMLSYLGLGPGHGAGPGVQPAVGRLVSIPWA